MTMAFPDPVLPSAGSWLLRDLPAAASFTAEALPPVVRARLESWLQRGEPDGESPVELLREMAETCRALRLGRLRLRFMLAEYSSRPTERATTGGASLNWHIAQAHRLLQSDVAAEAWLRRDLATEVGEVTANQHVRALIGLSAIEHRSGDNDTAVGLALRAIALAEEYPNAPDVQPKSLALALLQHSAAARTAGDYLSSSESLRRALPLAEASGDVNLTGQVHLRWGALLLAYGEAGRAIEQLESAAADFRSVSPHNALQARLRLVAAWRLAGDVRRAVAEAASLFADDTGSVPHIRLQIGLEWAEALQSLGDLDAAAHVLERVGRLTIGARSLEVARWHIHMARLSVAGVSTGSNRTDLEHVVEALRLAVDRHDLTRAAFAAALVPRLMGLPDAIRLYAARLCVALVDAQRRLVVEPGNRASLQSDRAEAFSQAAFVELDLGDPFRAVHAVEAGRSDLLETLLATVIPGGRDESGPGDTSNLGSAQTSTRSVQAPDEWILQAHPLTASRLDVMFAAVAQLTTALCDGVCPGTEVDSLFAATIQRSSEHPRLVLQLHRNAESLSLIRLWSLPGDEWSGDIVRLPEPVSWLVQTSLTAGVVPSPVRPSIWQLFAETLIPQSLITAMPDDSTLVLSPDQRLWALPLGALSWLHPMRASSGLPIVITPSLAVCESVARSSTPPDGERWAAGFVLAQGLPGSSVEAEILRTWNGRMALTESVEQMSDLSDLSRCQLLYVSGHGSGPGSRTTLGDGGLDLITLAEALLPPLVVLAGCWSGSPTSAYGRDPLSLALGALLGGARVVVAGSGPVHSAATGEAGAAYVERVLHGIPPAQALVAAHSRVRRAHPELPPPAWGGLFLVGAPSSGWQHTPHAVVDASQ